MDLSQSWAYIEDVADHRLDNNKTPRHVKKYGSQIEVLGAAGELAARRFLGLDEDLHEQFDHGVDLYWRGYRVDVKSTHLTKRINHRYLQWPEWKWVKSDIVLLIGVDMRKQEAMIIGWVWKDTVLEAPVNPERDTPCHEIPVPELRPAWELWTLEKHN
jgi:hypothetical protein